MNHPIEVPSPTEIVSNMDAEDEREGEDGEDDLNMEAAGVGEVDRGGEPADGPGGEIVEATRRKKRERDRTRRDEGRGLDAVTKDEEDEEESPSKRAHEREGEDAPLSGRELRALLSQHFQSVKHEMHNVWGEVKTKVEMIDRRSTETKEAIVSFSGRLSVAEKDNVLQQSELAKHTNQIQGLEHAVDDLKQQMAEIKVQGVSANSSGSRDAAQPPHAPSGSDPWAQYLQRRGHVGGGNGERGNLGPMQAKRLPTGGGEPDREGMSEEDKRTLIIGGWLQDTKKEIIITEASEILGREELKQYLDETKITVFGPRKSFGVIRFHDRPGENFYLVKERMWAVIKYVNALKHMWSSAAGQGKPAWISFMKSKGARQRSGHASMIRRIAIDLAGDAKDGQGAPKCPEAVMPDNYDVDWGAGTVWRQDWKLGSSVHRQPRGGDVRVMSGGWVDVTAMVKATGAAATEVTMTLERELNM